MAKIKLQNKFYLMRHGEAESNVLKILSASLNRYPLTTRGVRQVEEAAQKLATAGLTKIFTSPIKRTKQTAEIIADATKASIDFDKRLMEIKLSRDFYSHEGGHYYWEYIEWHVKNKLGQTPPGAEKLEDLRDRMMAAFVAINSTNQGETILIVSHADPLWMLESGLLNYGATGTHWRWLYRSYKRGELRQIVPSSSGFRFVKV
jgi:broad specificity phosphatase PhoE